MKSKTPILSEEKAAPVAEFFSAFSDTTRLRIISILLAGEINVKEISNLVRISESAASHQLRNLRLMRLVKTRKKGRQVFYSLDDIHIKDIFQAGVSHVFHG
jgi:ArsR family transcriptional regulator